MLFQTTSPLSSLKWKNRILIIHKDEALAKKFKRKIDSVQDRDMIVFVLNEANAASFPKNIKVSLPSLMKYFQINPQNSESILIGKDGGIKLRKRTTTPQEIFDLIDSMPMRQSEMKSKSGG